MARDESDEERPQLSWREQIAVVRVQVRNIERNLRKLEEDVNGTFKDQEKRIRTLENFRWWIVGAIIGSGIFSALANFALKKVFGVEP